MVAAVGLGYICKLKRVLAPYLIMGAIFASKTLLNLEKQPA